MEKKIILEELDKELGRMDNDVLSKLDMDDETPVTRKELREYILNIQASLLSLRDVMERLHIEEIRK